MSLKKIAAIAAAMLAAASLLAAVPTEAKQPKKVKPPFALTEIDRNGDRNISAKEWNWAEKHGYDRLTRQGSQVTRKTYQAHVNRYYSYVDWRDDHAGATWYGHKTGGTAPWELDHR
ncbi:hypothetical protein [Dongia rigui]|uniref:EF-hand domain-containing protein n=1 Tax=Dongia rigui TaxID=940149 RepID=A0ABU5DXR1_9PROT|nr:hypothetical protein [Dongia rigui]MDY0872111.1 hypothetical protein [Dongia rigui]